MILNNIYHIIMDIQEIQYYNIITILKLVNFIVNYTFKIKIYYNVYISIYYN